MKTRFLLIFLLFSVCLTLAQTDRRPDKSVLKIASFNAEFLWDGKQPEEGQVHFPHKGNVAEAEAHMADIASIIRRLNADILNLVEVENIEALTYFNSEFLSGMGYKPYLVKGKDTYTGQDVALLSRIDPVNDRIERTDEKGASGLVSKSVSKNYFAKFDISGKKFALIGIHFVAFPIHTGRKPEREAQANAIVNLAKNLRSEGYSIVVCGDFNDYDGQTLDHIGSMPISTVLLDIKGLDHTTSTDDLINVASYIPQAHRYTAFYDANRNGEVDYPYEFTSIDHILISPELAAWVSDAQIIRDYDPRLVSDHFPIAVTLSSDAPGPSSGTVRFISIMPNPVGDERINESVTLKNFGTASVDLTGWKLRDAANQFWTFSGTLAANETKVFLRNGQKMGMNNTGDVLELINPVNDVIQVFTYYATEEGVAIAVN